MFRDDKVTPCLRWLITFLRISSSLIITSDAPLYKCVWSEMKLSLIKINQILNIADIEYWDRCRTKSCRLVSDCQCDFWVLLPVYFCPVTGPRLENLTPKRPRSLRGPGAWNEEWAAPNPALVTNRVRREDAVKYKRLMAIEWNYITWCLQDLLKMYICPFRLW